MKNLGRTVVEPWSSWFIYHGSTMYRPWLNHGASKVAYRPNRNRNAKLFSTTAVLGYATFAVC